MTPGRDYLNHRDYTLVVFDLRVAGSAKRLRYERAAWRENADIEMLDFNHAVLLIRPGAAWRAAP